MILNQKNKFIDLISEVLPRHRNATLHRAMFRQAKFYRGIGMPRYIALCFVRQSSTAASECHATVVLALFSDGHVVDVDSIFHVGHDC
jgi:hypothetical protein